MSDYATETTAPPADPAPAVEPTSEAPAGYEPGSYQVPETAPAPPVEETPAWEGVSEDDWQATQEELAELREYLAQTQQGEGGDEGEGFEFDPLASNAVDQLRELIRQELEPIAGYQQAQLREEGNQRALDIIADLEASQGEFLFKGGKGELDSRQMSRQLADQLYPALAERYGPGLRASEQALEQAYKQIRAWEDAVGKAYHDRQVNQAHTIAGAPRELAGQGADGTRQHLVPSGLDERGVADRFFGAR